MQGGVNYNGSTLLSGSIDVNAGGNIKPLTLAYNENGNYVVNAPEGVDGYDPLTINVNVPQLEPVLDTLIVSQNGQYRPPEGVVGYNLVDVNVITPPPVLDTLNVSQNGQYTPPEGVVGYNQVNVNVPGSVLNTLNVSSNGTYTPPSGVDGYDEVVVNVPAVSYYCKDIILISHAGQYLGWQTMPNALTIGQRYLAIGYREADTIPVCCGVFTMAIDNNIEFARDKFIRFRSTTEISSPVAYSAGYSISIAKVPSDWWNNPFEQ